MLLRKFVDPSTWGVDQKLYDSMIVVAEKVFIGLVVGPFSRTVV